MPQVCVNESIPSVPADVWDKGFELNAFNALFGARESRYLLIRERALTPYRYMLFVDSDYASRWQFGLWKRCEFP